MSQETATPLTLPVQPLTAEAFKPYGEFVDSPPVSGAGRADHLAAWKALARSRYGDDPHINHLAGLDPNPAPITMLEIHHDSPQLTVMLDADWILLVADEGWTPDTPPNPATLHGFLVPKGQGVQLKAGLWHSGVRVVGQRSEGLAMFHHGAFENNRTSVQTPQRPILPALPGSGG